MIAKEVLPNWLRNIGLRTMAQSLSNILLHIVFSTKNREPFIDESIERDLFKYVATVARTLHCPTHGIAPPTITFTSPAR
jgi:hypothetical protein